MKVTLVPKGVRNINWYVVHEPPSEPDLAIVASGLMVGQAFEAVAMLEKEGVMVRIINLINHKSLDQSFAKVIPDKKPLLTVYNGNTDVLKANVAGALMGFGLNIPSKIYGLGFDLGTTGGTNDLLKAYGLDAISIAQSIKTKIL